MNIATVCNRCELKYPVCKNMVVCKSRDKYENSVSIDSEIDGAVKGVELPAVSP